MFKYQTTSYNCGPASLQNALYMLGKSVSQKVVAQACGTTPEGTDEFQLMRAIDMFGFRYKELRFDSEKSAWDGIPKAPTLLCVDEWSHWVCVRTLWHHEPRLLLVDPSRPKKKTWSHCCASVVTRSILIPRWRSALKHYDVHMPRYYGISVLPR